MSTRIWVLAILVLPATAGAQIINNTQPGTFLDISMTGGTALLGAADDSEHNIVTTIGNPMFPAGNVRIGSNGAVAAGVTIGDIGYTNGALPAVGLPTGLTTGMPAGASACLLPFWDDLYPDLANPNMMIWWQELWGILYIMWKDYGHISYVAGQVITFEIQVFGNGGGCTPMIQYVYTDTIFGGTHSAYDDALSATIGYVAGTVPYANTQYSFNTASINSTTVLSIFDQQPFVFTVTSPSGPGSALITIADCGGSAGYFMPFTFVQGAYPNGWLYGLDISWPDVFQIWSAGAPFRGPLPATIGPITGVPSGLPFWAVAIGLSASGNPTGLSAKLAYIVP